MSRSRRTPSHWLEAAHHSSATPASRPRPRRSWPPAGPGDGAPRLAARGRSDYAGFIRSPETSFSDPRARLALEEAGRARERAYAPYSRFRMGAAVVTDRDEVVAGALVENVSLGLAMCAERAALFSAVARDAGRPEVLALVAPRTRGELTLPCGACLQVALELAGPALWIVASDGRRLLREVRLRDLAPHLPFKGGR